jgi:hypothetical protein
MLMGKVEQKNDVESAENSQGLENQPWKTNLNMSPIMNMTHYDSPLEQ